MTYLRVLILIGIVFIALSIYTMIVRSRSKKSGNFMQALEGMLLITGEPGVGKTTLLAKMVENAKARGDIIISNFFVGQADLYWSSKDDLLRMLLELQFLGYAQNYSKEERIRMWTARFGKEWTDNMIKNIEAFSKIYPNIPVFTKYNTRFFLTGDEMYNYFPAREASRNFVDQVDKDGTVHEYSRFLELFNQIRHMNALMVFATQFDMDLDVKFRRAAKYLIKTTEVLGGIFKAYWPYYYTDDEKALFGIQGAAGQEQITMTPATTWPAMFFNGYKLNVIINAINKFLRINIKYRFGQLDFYSKDDVMPKIHCWDKNRTFIYLDAYYADKKKQRTLTLS